MGLELLINTYSKDMKSLILIKLGGSQITSKSKKDTVNKKNLNILGQQIKKAQSKGYRLIIAHGQGSFAHRPAWKYRTDKGIINKESLKGVCEVANKAAELNRIVVDYLFRKKIKVFSINPSSIMVAKKHKIKHIFLDSIEQLLKNDLTPVLYGDQIIDIEKGCTIFSAEEVLNNLALKLKSSGYQIGKIIHCTNVKGVYDQEGNIIEEINYKNFKKFKKNITESKNIDVTGGMIHKVEESLEMAKKNIESYVIDGSKKNNLLDVIEDKKFIGTKITK